MHSLNQIHSLNNQAAIDEFNRNCQRIIANGGSYAARKDELDRVDHTAPVEEFPTAANLKAHALANVPVHSLHKFHFVYGRN